MMTNSRSRFPIILLLAVTAVLLWTFAAASNDGRIPPKDTGKRIGKQSQYRRPFTPSSLDDIVSSSNTPFSIPDGPGGVVVDSIVVSEDITIDDLDVKIDITHSWIRDLTLTLTHIPQSGSPDSAVLLDLYSYGFAVNMTQTWFTDEAGYWILEAEPPMTGNFRPMNNLSRFNDRSAQGVWYLEIRDRFAFDSGTVNEWALEFNHVNVFAGEIIGPGPNDTEPLPRVHVSLVDTLETIIDTTEIVIDTVDTVIDTSYVTDTSYVIDLLDDCYTNRDGRFAFPRMNGDTVNVLVERPFTETRRFYRYVVADEPDPEWELESTYLFHTLRSTDIADTFPIIDGDSRDILLIGLGETVLEIADVDVALDITHAYIGDISMNLKVGSEVQLTDMINFDDDEYGDNLLDCRLDDDADKTLDEGIPPFTGVWQPTNSLSFFNDLLVMGNWTLTIVDSDATREPLDYGYLTRADVTIIYREVGSVSGVVQYGDRELSPVVGCRVSITSSDIISCTNQAGQFRIDGVLPGEQTLTLNHKIYTTDSTYTVDIQSGQTSTVDVVLESIYGDPETVNSGDIEYPIPDFADSLETPIIDSLELVVTEVGHIADVNVVLNISHTFLGDLSIRLIGPDTVTSATLTQASGDSLDNFVNTVFDDQSCEYWYESGSGADFTGSWIPESPLSVFDSINADGTWFLEISDTGNLDEGVLHNWALEFYVDPTITESPILDNDDDFTFHGNYPNPFNPSTTFSFDLIRDAQVKLILYNVLGQQVDVLLDKPLTQGFHQVSFDANALPSGIYFARLSSPHQSNTRKIILLK